MEFLNELVNQINGLVWGPPMLVLILGTGFFLMMILKLMPLRRIGTGFAMMVSGVVVTETVFNIPGLGRLVVDGVLARDYPLIQAIILLTAGTYVLINLLIDLSYALTDPRIRYQ